MKLPFTRALARLLASNIEVNGAMSSIVRMSLKLYVCKYFYSKIPWQMAGQSSDSGFVGGDSRRDPWLPHSHRGQRLSFNGKESKMAAAGGGFLKIGKPSEVAANI